MNRRSFTHRLLAVGLLGTGGIFTGSRPAKADSSMSELEAIAPKIYELTVFRSPTCGCCEGWTAHIQAAGFAVDDRIIEDMDAIKQRYGVRAGLDSCHTALVGGYVIEGHVPAEDVQRLLAEKPNVIGITAPGMPMGSPGMETDEDTAPYTVFSFKADGTVNAFAQHG
ncbi:MAG: DUF411 domain-containing protein [Phormidesmis sp.]